MSSRSIKNMLLVSFICLTVTSCFGCNDEPKVEVEQLFDPDIIATLDANYFIDYENGTIPIGDLPLGARVADPTWKWEHRLGVNYSDRGLAGGAKTPPGKVKPVTWIVVDKDHYGLGEAHVTLLTEELIGRFVFDDSNDRGHENENWGHNHWGESGNTNANHGLRLWLNSTGIHSDGGFYQAFSENFKKVVLTTDLPNKEWQNGIDYITNDQVFIPSSTELGDVDHKTTYQIGKVYSYFQEEGKEQQAVRTIGGSQFAWMFNWTRSPDSTDGGLVWCFYKNGFTYYVASYDSGGVRPALNIKSDTMVSEINR